MTRGTKRTLGAGRVIPAGVGHDSRTQRDEVTVGVGADGEFHGHRMPLDVVLRGLLAREHRFNRSAKEPGGNGGLSLNRQFFFRAKGAAACDQRDFDVLRIELEDLRELCVVVDRTLTVGVDANPIPARSPGMPRARGTQFR